MAPTDDRHTADARRDGAPKRSQRSVADGGRGGVDRRRFLRGAAGAGTVAVLAATGGSGFQSGRATRADRSARSFLGTNLPGPSDWQPEQPFVDVFKLSREWISHGPGEWDDGREVATDDDGWVTSLQADQAAGTLMLWGDFADEYVPDGRYVLTYDGTGRVETGVGDASVVSREPGRVVLEVSGRIHLQITAVDESDHIRNMQLFLPGFEGADEPTFRPAFLDQVRPLVRGSVVRFMDLLGTNDSTLSQWADRPTPDSARYTGQGGVAVEHLVDLAEALDADPWFCVPHRATDRFVREFAELANDRLDDAYTPYVEYTNEAWNFMFDQAGYCRRRAREAGLGDGFGPALRWYSRRATEIFDIWTDVFGADGVVRVMGSQAANSWVSEQVLAFEDAGATTDALGIAPYVGMDAGDVEPASDTVEDVLDLAEERVEDLFASGSQLEEHRTVAGQHDVDVVAYEGGQHFVARTDPDVRELFRAAQTHPRMDEVYAEYLRRWEAATDGGVFCHFSSTSSWGKYGYWGAANRVLEDPARTEERFPKYRALVDARGGGDTTPPSVPEGLSSPDQSSTSVDLTWSAVGASDLGEYRVSVDGTARTSVPAGTTATTVSGLSPDTSYEFAVSAVDDAGNESDRSAAITVSTEPEGPEARIHRIASPPTVDGSLLDWGGEPEYAVDTVVRGSVDGPTDLAAEWRARWDDAALYVLVIVRDDAIETDGPQPWQDDSVEVYLDPTGDGGSSYDGDAQFVFRYGDGTVHAGANSIAPAGVEHAVADCADGYVLEAAIPWSTLSVDPAEGHVLGIDVHVNDDDGSDREGKLAWHAGDDTAWRDPSTFGTARLVAPPGGGCGT